MSDVRYISGMIGPWIEREYVMFMVPGPRHEARATKVYIELNQEAFVTEC